MHIRSVLALSICLGLATPAVFAADRDVDKVNGSITIDNGERIGNLETVNGAIHVGDHARAGSAETVNGSIAVGAQSQVGELSTVNGSIHVAGNVQVNGDVSTVNGGIFVDRGGNVRGHVETVNGAIGLVDTDLSGGIETVNGDVTVGVGSHVVGGIVFHKPGKSWFSFNKRLPRVVIGPNARVDGSLVFERDVALYVHATARTGAITGATAHRYDTPAPPTN